jgi:hypothetical protein
MGARSDSSYPAGRTFTDRDGVLHPSAQTVNVITTAVSRLLTADESGSVVIVTAADKVITLPATQAGLTYTVVLGNGGLSGGTGLSVSPAAVDKIDAASDDADFVNSGASDTVGDSCTVVGDGAGGWYAINVQGTWV